MRKPYLGIWLDHRDAYLFWADADGETQLQHAQADYEENRKRPGAALAGGTGVHGGIPPHADIEDKRRRQKKGFYADLLKDVQKAERVYLFGPGQAKRELAKVLEERKGSTSTVAGVATAERMTMAQMAAQVRDFFGLPRTAA